MPSITAVVLVTVVPTITAVVLVTVVPGITGAAVARCVVVDQQHPPPARLLLWLPGPLRRRRFTFTASRTAEFIAVLVGTTSELVPTPRTSLGLCHVPFYSYPLPARCPCCSGLLAVSGSQRAAQPSSSSAASSSTAARRSLPRRLGCPHHRCIRSATGGDEPSFIHRL